MRQWLATFTTFTAGIVATLIVSLAWSALNAQSSALLCIGQDRVVRAAAGTTCSPGEKPVGGAAAAPQQQAPAKTDDPALHALQDRVKQLEVELAKVATGAIVKAPFTVTDSSGKPIFIVTDYASNLSRGIYLRNPNGGLSFSASIPSVDKKGGLMKVYDGSGPDPNTYVGVAAFGGSNLGINIREKDIQRMVLWKNPMSNRFVVAVNGDGGKMVAGLGESEGKSGIVAVGTPQGDIRASMHLWSANGSGVIGLHNSNGVAVVDLGTASAGGGLLMLGGPAGNTQVTLGVTGDNDGVACVRKIKSGQTCVGPTLPGIALGR